MKNMKAMALILFAAILLSGCQGAGVSTAAGESAGTGGKGGTGEESNQAAGANAQDNTQKDTGGYTINRNSEGKIVIKAGHQVASDGVWQVGFEAFAKAINEVSGDQFEVQIYPSGQLGDQSELIQQLQLGTVEMCASSCADLGNYAPVCGLLDVPYLFESKQHAWNVMDGEIGEMVDQEIRDKVGINVMGYWSGGTRNIFSSKGAVYKAEDVKGLKMRTQPNDVHVKAFESLGVVVSPIAYTELYGALQQKVVDAAENDLSNYYQMKFYEVCKSYSKTEHIIQVATGIALVSPYFYNSLTDEERGWFDEACRIAQEEQRRWVEDSEADFVAKLEAEGVTMNEVDKQSFVDAVMPFYEDFVYPAYTKELVDQIKAVPAE